MKIRKMLILSMTCLASSTLMCVSHVYADTNANINVGESVGMVSNGNQGTESSGHGNKNTTSSSGSSYHSTQAELNANNEKQSALDAIKKWKDLASSMDETKMVKDWLQYQWMGSRYFIKRIYNNCKK